MPRFSLGEISLRFHEIFASPWEAEVAFSRAALTPPSFAGPCCCYALRARTCLSILPRDIRESVGVDGGRGVPFLGGKEGTRTCGACWKVASAVRV